MGFNPDQPRDGHGRWTDTGSVGELFDALLQDFEGDIVAEDVAYPGDFHDAVKDYFVRGLRAGGNKVETEVLLVLPGTPPTTARIDILARDPKGVLYGIDIKTGDDPTFTPGQRVVYPHAIGGAGVVSFDGKIRNLGLTPGVLLPAFAISVVYARDPGSPLEDYSPTGRATMSQQSTLVPAGVTTVHDFEGREYDLSMYLYLIVGERLITRTTALAIARLVLADRFGSQEVEMQEPFHIEEQGKMWMISGSRQPDWDDGRPRGVLRRGKAEMIISQLDGRIIKLAVEAPIPPPDDAGGERR